MIDALAIDAQAVYALANVRLMETWFSTFTLPDLMKGKFERRTVTINGRRTVYLFTTVPNLSDQRLLVVDLSGTDILGGEAPRADVFRRILRVALHSFHDSAAIPTGWHPYHSGSHFSIYASSAARGGTYRLYFDSNPSGTNSLFSYAMTKDITKFEKIGADYQLFDSVFLNFSDAKNSAPDLENADQPLAGYSATSIELPNDATFSVTGGHTVDEWCSRYLTAKQLDFVKLGYDKPVQLTGPAGSGKTLALIVKFIRDAYEFNERGETKKLAFICHSALTAERVRNDLRNLDYLLLLQNRTGVQLRILTLYDLAQEMMRYNTYNLYPIADSAHEARLEQYNVILGILNEIGPSLEITYGRHCGEFIHGLLKDKAKYPLFAAHLLNEFAFVLDAENIRLGTADVKKLEIYKRSRRPQWLLPMSTKADREMALLLHQKYREYLRGMSALSVDQMIGDLNGYLSSNLWDSIRAKEGMDAIFLDELHLFNRLERMIFTKLLKASDGGGPRSMFMAFDAKQATRLSLTALNVADESLKLEVPNITLEGNAVNVELTDVFRSTREIVAFLKDLDESHPPAGVASSLGTYKGIGKSGNGDVPVLWKFTKKGFLYQDVFKAAEAAVRTAKGASAAVLCMDASIFEEYKKVAMTGPFAKSVELVESQEDHPTIQYATKRFVFSQPEYVLGLQFDHVFLIHVDQMDSSNSISWIEERDFLDRAYRGASRAKQSLILAACDETGGVQRDLQYPMAQGTLLEVKKR